jgi:transketolase
LIEFIPNEEFIRVEKSVADRIERLNLISLMCRLNTLFMIKRAGSGHLGTSFSAMDIFVFLYFDHMNLRKLGIKNNNRDIYFSSKGHDVPGQYSVLYALGILPEEKFFNLRRLNGLDGHPDVKIPGIEANTGSLGMGISKARGVAFSKDYLGYSGKVFVMTGDGEWQEGQNFEALQSTVAQKQNNVTVIIDHNKLQSDRLVDRIVSLGNLEEKFRSFGWHVERCDGHDFIELKKTFSKLELIKDKPKILIADTIKGSGVSFMEHPQALNDNCGYYKWHSGAPDDENFKLAFDEIKKKIHIKYALLNLGKIETKLISPPEKSPYTVSKEFLSEAYGDALVKLAPDNNKFIVLDADLSFDCKLRKFEDTYPSRFVECGIAEQDMVSMAAGMARQGLIPVVNSFANFLAARANEQIYNSLTENNKVIYACHYAGLLPAGPGKSHQSLRDISLFGAFPNIAIVHPGTSLETNEIVHWAIQDSNESVMIQLPIGPSPQIIHNPQDSKFKVGAGRFLKKNSSEVFLFSYGPVILNEALKAHEILSEDKIPISVVNMPWINRFDAEWIESTLESAKYIFVLEDHSPYGALADHLISYLNENTNYLDQLKVIKIAPKGFPACGTPIEVLSFHGVDGKSVAKKIAQKLKSNTL